MQIFARITENADIRYHRGENLQIIREDIAAKGLSGIVLPVSSENIDRQEAVAIIRDTKVIPANTHCPLIGSCNQAVSGDCPKAGNFKNEVTCDKANIVIGTGMEGLFSLHSALAE